MEVSGGERVIGYSNLLAVETVENEQDLSLLEDSKQMEREIRYYLLMEQKLYMK